MMWRNAIREMTERKRNTLNPRSGRVRDRVAEAAQRIDTDAGAEIAEPLAQPVDIDLDGVRADLVGEAVEVVLEEALRYDAALAPHQPLEDGELARGEDARLVADEDLAGGRVEGEV